MLKPTDVARFWSGVDRPDANPETCWRWIRHTDASGYGTLVVAKKIVRAHRVSWEIANGPIPGGKHVLHRCDTPPCVRPSHLFVGTPADNAADRVSKGRGACLHGTLNGRALLTEAQVVRIKERYVTEGITLTALARDYGVSPSLIGKIMTGKTWLRVGQVVSQTAQGRRRRYRALTEQDVRQIRERRATGESGVSLAREYDVSTSTISTIVNRKRWRSVT